MTHKALILLLVFSATAWAVDSPKCSVISGRLGGPAILINGRPHSPVMFMANNQFNRDDVLFEEVKKASAAGVNLIGFNIPLDWRGTPEQAAGIIDMFCKANPDAYYYVRVWVGANAEWLQEHPGECITKYSPTPDEPATVSRLQMASPSSELWREATAKMLRDRVTQIANGPHADRFIGVLIEYLQTAEWFYPDTNDFMDYSPANLRAFRQWLRKTYKKDSGLQKAWHDNQIKFDTAQLPTPDAREASSFGPFRGPAQRPAIDVQRFQNELIPDTIAYLAAAVKEAGERRPLVGVYYGYTMELNGNGPRALVQSGHLALARLLECKDVDLIHAPLSYFERAIGQPGHFHSPVDSIVLHGKLPIFEEDCYTHQSQAPPPELIAPGWQDRTATSEQTSAVVARDFGACFNHRAGVWLFDLLSDGRWQEDAVCRTVSDLRRIPAALRTVRPFAPQIAFVVDEESPHCLKASTHPILIQSLSWWRSEMDRIGAPVGYYLQSDLPNLPPSLKLVVLANAFQLSREERRAVDKLLKNGATVIFNYAPDAIGPEGFDISRIKTITGIAVDAKSDDTPMTIVSAITDEEMPMDPASWRPRFVVTSKDADVVARYKATGETSAAAIRCGKGVSIYTATPRLPVECLREIARRAGVHLYRTPGGMLAVAGPYLVVHTEAAGTIEFTWPAHLKAVQRLLPDTPDALVVESSHGWSDRLPAHSTAIYIVSN